jgi:hypothetical protein
MKCDLRQESIMDTHEWHLEQIVKRPFLIGIEWRDISIIIPEPRWFKDNLQLSICDVIYGLHDNSAIAVELKHSYNHKDKALEQINQGRRYILENTNFNYKGGLFVVYDFGRFRVERV